MGPQRLAVTDDQVEKLMARELAGKKGMGVGMSRWDGVDSHVLGQYGDVQEALLDTEALWQEDSVASHGDGQTEGQGAGSRVAAHRRLQEAPRGHAQVEDACFTRTLPAHEEGIGGPVELQSDSFHEKMEKTSLPVVASVGVLALLLEVGVSLGVVPSLWKGRVGFVSPLLVDNV